MVDTGKLIKRTHRLNKHVCKNPLSQAIELEFLMDCGMEFLILGPAMKKALSPDFLVHVVIIEWCLCKEILNSSCWV